MRTAGTLATEPESSWSSLHPAFPSLDLSTQPPPIFSHAIHPSFSCYLSTTKINIYNHKANEKNLNQLINGYDIIVDGSDNFKTKFLLNKFSLKFKKKLIVGAISKFDGHVFAFNFTSKKSSCLKCFYQSEPSDEILNCETEGIFGSTANIIGGIQANETLKAILNIGNNFKSNILILDLLNLNFRKVLYKKRKNCIC